MTDTFMDVGVMCGLKPGEIRGQGHTTWQMKHAPPDAVFVWCNGHLDYPMHLAEHLGRLDLDIRSPNWLTDPWTQRGPAGRDVVIDHAYSERSTPDKRR